MEIKRRLNKIASRLSPQLEAMNIADEMRRMCQRFEEIVAYGEEKLERAASKDPTIGQKVQAQKAAIQKEIEDHQRAEAEENLKDQEESFKERNRLMEKSQKPKDLRTEMEVAADEEAEASRQERGATKEEDMAALAKEVAKPAKKKAKKK